MPTYSIQAPNGKTYRIEGPAGATQDDVIAEVMRRDPSAGQPPPTTAERLKGAAARGFEAVPESMAGVGLGIKSALGMASAGEQAAAIREEAKKPQVPGTSWESIEQAYEKEGLLSALKKTPSFVGEKILESAPSMAVPIAAGAAAGAMSGPFAPIVAPLAGIGTYGVQQFGQFMRRQAEEGATGETLAPGKAAVASAVTAPLGYFADRFTLGLSKLPTKAIGNEIAAELAKRTSGVAGRAVKGASIGIVAEAPTEVLEQAAERWQAGLSLTDEEAKREYKEAAAAAVAIGGVGGAASRVLQGAPKAEVTPEAPSKVTPEVQPEAPPEVSTTELEQLSPEQRRILAQQRAVAERPEDVLAGVQKQIQTGQPTTMDDVARIKDEHETAIIEGLLNQDAEMKQANDFAQAQLQQQQDQARTQLQDQSTQETLNNAIAGTDARVREGRLLSRVQDLIENNIPFASTAINDINSKFQLIKEAPLTEQERARVQNIMGMAQAFTNFVNLPQLPPKAVDRFAENQQMEQQIKERKAREQLPAQPIRTATPAPSPVIQKDAIGKGIDEGAAPRPPSGIEPSTAEDSQLGLGRSQTFGIAPPTDGAPVTKPVATETKAPEAVPPVVEDKKLGTPTERQEAIAFGKAIGATQPYPGSLSGRVNLPAQKAAKEGNFQGVLSALEKSKNVIVAEIARRAKSLSTKIVIDDQAEETYAKENPLMRQMSIDGAKMHLEALNKIRELASQVDALPDGSRLGYNITDQKINAFDEGKDAGQISLSRIADNGHSMFSPLPTGPVKLKTKEDFKALQKAFEDITNEVGEDALQMTSTGSAKSMGVAGAYDSAADTIRVPEYFAKDEQVLAHEIVHAQVLKIIASPSLREKPIVIRLNKLYQHVKAQLEEKAKQDKNYRKPYALESIQEFVAEGMGNPSFQLELKRIKYENTSAWDSFVQTIANLIGVKRDTAFTELLSVYSELTAEATPAAATKTTPIEEGPMPKSIDQIETEKRADEQVEPIQKYIGELTKKPMNLWNVLRGRLSASDVSDISPDFKYMALRQPAKKGGGTDLSELVQSGQLDEFLPPAMRMSMQDPNEMVDETDAVEYIKEKLRGSNEDYYTYDTQMALREAFGSIEEAENAVREFIRIEDANELLAEAAAEQRAIDKEAEVITPEGEDRTAQESVQEGLTAPTPESLKATDERAKAEEKRIAAEKKAADDKAKADAEVAGFTLTGSDRPADVAAAAGQKSMFSLRGKPDKQITAFEQSLRTLLNKFGLKEIGLKLSEGMRDEGSYAAKLIQIAADSANPIRTLRHESVHALRELGFFTNAQWKSLSKMAKDKWIDQYLKQRNIDGKPLKAGEESRYDAYMREYKGDMEKITEEAVADAFADFDTKPPAGMIQAIIQRLRNLFQSIRSALTKMESAEQIFGKVEKGALKPEAERVTTESKSLRDRATANFKRWFGDSKVVDEKGEPLMMYHGTVGKINSFKPGAYRGGTISFAYDKDYALEYAMGAAGSANEKNRKAGIEQSAKPIVEEVYLSIKNPFKPTKENVKKVADRLNKNGETAPSYFGTWEKALTAAQDDVLETNAVVKAMKEVGFDGQMVQDGSTGITIVNVFNPTQIKSATGNNGDYSLTDADIRKSLRTTTGGEAAMETLKRMGREVKPPEDGYVKKTKQAWNNAVDNPQTTAQAVKDTLVRWGDQVQTWAFSSDAALNNNLKRAIMDSAKADPEKTAFLLNTSLSQTVHADALASLFITEGNIRYNKELLKWEAVKDKDNLVSLVKGLEDISKKYNLTKEEAQLIGHTAFEAKRLKSLVAFNEVVDKEVKEIRREAARLKEKAEEMEAAGADEESVNSMKKSAQIVYDKSIKRKNDRKFIHMTDEQIADGNALFKNIPELDSLVKTWNGIRTNATKVLVDTGLWSEADADFLLSNADYVPFFREDQLENGKGPKEFISGLQVQAVDRKLKGSNKPVNDIFDNMVRWTQYSINRGVRNRSAVALAEGAAEMGMARKVPVRAGNENVVRVWKNGEEVLYSMADPMFIPAFTGLESIALPSWKILSKFSNILRQSVVMYPLFSISQVPQDAFAAMFTSGLKPQYALRIPVLAVKEFVKTLAGKSKTHEELKMFGATGVRDFTADMARVDAEVLAGLKAEPGILNSIKGKLHHIAMASDNAVRQATYEAAMAQGMSQKEALEKSFEIWNIRRKGSSSTLAIAGQVIPFFNAYLAAQNVMVKVITGQGTSPTKKAEAYKTLAATTASVMTLSLLYTMMNGDDEDYLDKPAAQRDRLLMIPGSGGMSIPLRKDLYTMPKIITEHTYLLMTDKGYEDGRKFRDSMKAALASTFFSPTAVPQALKPLIEVGINYDFFTGRPIIGQFQKKLEVERQFNDTTAELAKVFGSTGLVSPLNAEHLIRGMFGSVGGLVLYATNPILHSDPNVERPTLSAREMLATLPGTSGFISREDQTGLKNDFYVLRDEVAKVASTISDMKARSPEKLEDYLSSEDVIAKYGMSKAVNKMVEQLGKIRKQITQITNLPSDAMTGEEKQDQIKELKALEKDMLKSINVKELRAAAKL